MLGHDGVLSCPTRSGAGRYDARVIPGHTGSASLAALLVAVLALAACGSATDTPLANPSRSPSPSPTSTPSEATPTPVPGGSTQPSSSLSAATQTATDWGRIWDSLPASFPRYPGAIPTETAGGPASASLAVGASADEAATNVQSLMEAGGFSTVGRTGPMEDGSFVIDSVGAAGCRIQTRLTPLSGTTAMAILYGAECPFE